MLRKPGAPEKPATPDGSADGKRPWCRRRVRPDAGAISLFVAIVTTGFVSMIGLVVDAGGRLRAIENTDARAQEAARVAGQQLDEAGVLQGRGFKVLEAYASQAANAYLGLFGLSGSASLTADGTGVVVTVSTTYKPALLSLVPKNGWGITGRGSAILVHGVKKAENG
ncbi:hypothetical protein [Kitasatospora sp. NPDC057223]|uniref:hypothetical protein n=1 Tax=Kitasatospora sp. NPDC057223 TaxID=3346055 RepID=UPI00362D2B01